MELNIKQQARGVRILAGEEAAERRLLLNKLITIAESNGFQEIMLPSIEPADVYTEKAGAEVLEQMYVFPDKKGRQLCLRPEGTATVQLIADQYFPNQKDVKVWYFEKCWRYERPQAGRYREFFQFGVEVINPSNPCIAEQLLAMAEQMVACKTSNFETTTGVKRGLDYYTEAGFEISVPTLGAQQQVVGGGRYKQGIGFAIGFDRLMLCNPSTQSCLQQLPTSQDPFNQLYFWLQNRNFERATLDDFGTPNIALQSESAANSFCDDLLEHFPLLDSTEPYQDPLTSEQRDNIEALRSRLLIAVALNGHREARR